MADDLTRPELTVVLPCFNVASTLREQLDALTSESWSSGSWEVLVVDNGSSDQTAAIAESYSGGKIPVSVMSAIDGQSVAYARNAGIAAAGSPLVAICDGDDVIQPGWVAALGGALRLHDLVGGLVDPSLVNEPWLARTRPLGTPGQLPQFGGHPFVSGGNCGIRKELWSKLGGYDEHFRGLEDIEFSLRARAIGIEPALAPGAVVGYRYREGLGPLWKQGFFYGRGRRELTRRARALGLSGASLVAAFKSWAWLIVHLPKLFDRSGRYEWVWVLSNRIGAVRGLFDRAPAAPISRAPAAIPDADGDRRFHGVLITYRRPDDLKCSLKVLADQTRRLDTLIVVDNGAEESAARIVADAIESAGSVRYLPTAENMGPAGGIHAGVAAVLETAHDDDWVILLDDDDPPQRVDCFEVLQRLLDEQRRSDPRCAAIGLWGARLNRWTGRVRVATGTSTEDVDYLAGGSCPHYSAAALRQTGLPDPEMFFGFDDLELGLRLRDAGFGIVSSGVARENGLAHMVEGRRATARSVPPTWRRYYSLRNVVIVLRAHGATRGAVTMSLAAGIVKPSLNLLRHPQIGIANLRINVRALRDGWAGRMGKTIDPDASNL